MNVMTLVYPRGYPNHERYDPDISKALATLIMSVMTLINPMGYPNHERYDPDISKGLP